MVLLLQWKHGTVKPPPTNTSSFGKSAELKWWEVERIVLPVHRCENMLTATWHLIQVREPQRVDSKQPWERQKKWRKNKKEGGRGTITPRKTRQETWKKQTTRPQADLNNKKGQKAKLHLSGQSYGRAWLGIFSPFLRDGSFMSEDEKTWIFWSRNPVWGEKYTICLMTSVSRLYKQNKKTHKKCW